LAEHEFFDILDSDDAAKHFHRKFPRLSFVVYAAEAAGFRSSGALRFLRNSF
jgi:hypothetical protein